MWRIYLYGLIVFGETQADKYYLSLISHFDKIVTNPYLYQTVNHIKPEYRRCVCGSNSIFYRIVDGNIEIMAIVGQQDLQHGLRSINVLYHKNRYALAQRTPHPVVDSKKKR